ncbi:TetR/AcrR family transcriptional regulator [Alteribacillus sp. YIM 98480]|uniref:TetR/AcrR family transcriptional regulator n=1 Tax=Alteribacillus sp. YIM 98480 TaxID=2606599 RepID=UPI00131C166C|nr:TetR/AcrR family transcriptional regulator [Alteribacillus sp. YIM 98480]
MSPRKAVDQELSREIIMEAARKLFVKHGYQNVSIRKIAQTLDYSHGSIYYHFKNKAELFYSLVDQDFSMLNIKLDEILKRSISPNEKIKAVLLGYIQFGLTHQNHYEIMFLIKDEEIKNYVIDGPNKTYEKFAQAIYTLSSNGVNVKTIWTVFLMLHGFVAHYCHSGQSFQDVSGFAESYVDDILTGILQA